MNKQTIKERIISSPFRRLYYHYIYWTVFFSNRGAIKRNLLSRPKEERPSMFKVWWVMVIKLWLPEEYFSYHYESLTRKERRKYVLNWEKDVFANKVNNKSVQKLLDDKYASYMHFRQFYQREMVLIDFNDDLSKAKSFFEAHPKAIIKKNTGGSGHGVQIVNTHDYPGIDNLYFSLKEQYESKKIILEELIQQHPKMSSLHPQSVNTLRMPTIHVKDEILFFHPGMRIGRGDSIVDNGGSGGILAAIDEQTGCIKAAAIEDGTDYIVHPDTNIPLIGFQIPLWEEAKAFTMKLMQALPEGVYISWDIALTEKGWVMVEGNSRGQFFGRQLPIHKGVRDEFEEIKKNLNCK